MSAYTEINLEYGMPTVSDAMDHLKFAIERCRREKYKCLLIIHGYGSSGKGGAICEKSRQWLVAQKRNGKVKEVIFGENFEIFNFRALALKNKYHELERQISGNNHGVTIVEL